MSEFENTPVVVFSQQPQRRKRRSPSQVLARKEDKNNSLDLARISLENIMTLYQEFANAYKHNNVYQLFRISEDFYNNTTKFISASHHLFKHKLIKTKDADCSIIFQNMNILIEMIDQLNAERDNWISQSSILDEPKFALAVKEGTNRIDLLKEKIQNFLKASPEPIEIENEKDKIQSNNMHH